MLLSRYVTFCKMLLNNEAFEVRFLSDICIRKKWTVLGKSMSMIAELCDVSNLTDLSANVVRKKVRYAPIPPTETWRIGIIKDMLDTKGSETTRLGLTDLEKLDIQTFACTS